MEMRPYEPLGGKADMLALNAPSAADAVAAEARIARERGDRLDACVEALRESSEEIERLRESNDRLAEECARQRALAEESVRGQGEGLAELRDEIRALYGDVADRALSAGERAVRHHMGWMSDAVREQDESLREGARSSVAAVRAAADEATRRVIAASASAARSIERSGVDAGKVMGEMRRQYLASLLVVPVSVALLVVSMGLFAWFAWPLLTGMTMTDLDAANLRIEQLSAELDAYKSTGAALGDERQRELDERLRALQEEYDAAHRADAAE